MHLRSKILRRLKISVYLVFDTLENLSKRTSSVDGILETNFEYDSCFGNIGIENYFLSVLFWAMNIDTNKKKMIIVGNIFIELDFRTLA